MSRRLSLALASAILASPVPHACSQTLELTSTPTQTSSKSLIGYGITRGFVHGLAVADIVSDSDASTAAMATGGLLGAAVEGTAAWMVLGRTTVTAGAAHTFINATDYGFLSAYGLAKVGNLDSKDQLAVALAGAGIGGVAGGMLWVPHRRDVTWGDAETARAAALAGAIAGGTIGAAADQSPNGQDHETIALGSVVGGTLGLLIGDLLTRHTRFDSQAGITTDLSVLFGVIVPGVFVEYAPPGKDENYSVVMGAGAIAGWVVAYLTQRGDSRGAGHGSMTMRVNPLALAMLSAAPQSPGDSTSGSTRGFGSADLASFRMQF